MPSLTAQYTCHEQGGTAHICNQQITSIGNRYWNPAKGNCGNPANATEEMVQADADTDVAATDTNCGSNGESIILRTFGFPSSIPADATIDRFVIRWCQVDASESTCCTQESVSFHCYSAGTFYQDWDNGGGSAEKYKLIPANNFDVEIGEVGVDQHSVINSNTTGDYSADYTTNNGFNSVFDSDVYWSGGGGPLSENATWWNNKVNQAIEFNFPASHSELTDNPQAVVIGCFAVCGNDGDACGDPMPLGDPELIVYYSSSSPGGGSSLDVVYERRWNSSWLPKISG
jgi:hypothetical protein